MDAKIDSNQMVLMEVIPRVLRLVSRFQQSSFVVRFFCMQIFFCF